MQIVGLAHAAILTPWKSFISLVVNTVASLFNILFNASMAWPCINSTPN